jgi:outer membrane protein assembly factor BamA
MCIKRLLISLLTTTLFSWSAFCQDTATRPRNFEQQDIRDWLIQKKILKDKPPKKNFLLIIPVIASNPSAGLIFGAGCTYAFKSDPDDTRISTMTANATYSTKGLLNTNMKSNAFVLHEKLILNGDWRYLINNETTYGLGTTKYQDAYASLNGYEISADSLGVPMKYNQVRLHETGSFLILKNFFAGIGIHYDHFYNISDQALTEGDTSHSYQYQYSKDHGFDPKKYTAMGVSMNLLYDSRDNQVNAYKGIYANVNYRLNYTALGSSKNSTMLLTEFRSFIPLDGASQRNILAFWIYGSFVTSGEVPYLMLPALGYDQRQRSGRGYTFGRFRGEELLYGESEYRFPISRQTGILGGVLFVNCTTTTDKKNGVELMDYLRPGWGGGLRIMMDKKSRTRIEVDAGVVNRSVGFYFGAQETF